MKKKQLVTEEDVQLAIQKFVRDGGLIQQLPDQVAPRNLMVGARWGIYEPVMETASVTGSTTSSGTSSGTNSGGAAS